MYYKIEALRQAGKKIILHYFDYRPFRDAGDLKKICVAVYRYPRKPFWQSLPLQTPHIVSSRISQAVANQLNKDSHPVLLEGFHCSGLVPLLNNKARAVVRLHNDEAAYYHHLANAEANVARRLYYRHESRLLTRYQQQFDKEVPVACLSETDLETMKNNYGFRRAGFVPCFVPWQSVACPTGSGKFCLYHGNMAVAENEAAAAWLIESVFSKISVPLIIAGSGISPSLIEKGKGCSNIRFENQPTMAAVEALVKAAHVHVLPSLNSTGVKLKLLNALLNGRFCLTNTNGAMGSRISTGLLVKDSANDWINTITALMARPFNWQDREERQDILALYNNRQNAERLSALWSHYQ